MTPSSHPFHQQTLSVAPQSFETPILDSHYIFIHDVVAKASAAKGDGETAEFILKKPLNTLKGSAIPVSSLPSHLSRIQRILTETGVFREVRVELDDADLLGEMQREYRELCDEGESATDTLPYAARNAALKKRTLPHVFFANAKIHALEHAKRKALGIGASVNMDGDTEINVTASYRNLLRLADVTSLTLSGTNASFSELFQSNGGQMSWADAVFSNRLMWSLSWRAPFLLGEMLTLRARTGAECIHDTDLTQHSRGFEVHTKLSPKHSMEYSLTDRNLLIGGNYQNTLQRIGGPKSSLRSEVRHTYLSQELVRDENGSPLSGYTFRVESSVSGLSGVGNSRVAKSQMESNVFFRLFGPLVGNINTKVGAAAPLSVLERMVLRQGDAPQDDTLYIGDRVFANVRGYNQVGSLTYVEQIQSGSHTLNAYQSKGGNLAASATARVILPFRDAPVPVLKGLPFLYAHGFVTAGNASQYDFRSPFDWRDFTQNAVASYGAGLCIPLGDMRIEFNYSAPLYRPLGQVGALQNFQRFQLRFFLDW